jgi:hypothetical protein
VITARPFIDGGGGRGILKEFSEDAILRHDGPEEGEGDGPGGHGKGHKNRMERATNVGHSQSLVDKNQHLKIDVMKLNTHIFITSVMKPLDITFTTKIPNLWKKNVKEGIKKSVNQNKRI